MSLRAGRRVAHDAWILFTAVLVCSPAIAQELALDLSAEAVRPAARFSIYFENDGTFAKRWDSHDRHYTSGQGGSVGWEDDEFWGGAGALIPFGASLEDPRYGGGFAITQQIFTPAELDTARVVTDDRPYAGYLYASAFVQRTDETTFDHAQLDLGIVGRWSGGEFAQKFVHNALALTEPIGWGNQLKNELSINLALRRTLRVPLTETRAGERGFMAELLPYGEIDLGTVYRQAEIGSSIRLGWNVRDDFGPGRMAAYGDVTSGRTPGDISVYVYGRASLRLVQHNIFLDGNTWTDSHSVPKRSVVGEGQIGIAATFWDVVEVGYSYTFSTNEFEGQLGGGDSFGALVISGRWEF